MNRANDLLLLLLNLSQMRSRSKIMELFLESLGDLFAPVTFQRVNQKPAGTEVNFPVGTRTSAYGYIVLSAAEPLPADDQNHLHNAIQMLAVVLERLDLEQKLETDKSSVERLAEDRLQELSSAVAQLRQSRNAHINLVEDLTQEIETRRQVEAELRRQQAMLARTEGIAHVGSWEWEVASDRVTWSDEMFRIFQRDPQAGAPGFTAHPQLYHPDDMRRLAQAVAAAVADGTPYELELRALRTDGQTRLCVARGLAERSSDGHVCRLFGSLQDITERQQAAAALRSKTALLEAQVNASPDGILVVDENHKRVLCNQHIAKLFQVPPAILQEEDDAALLNHVVSLTKDPEQFLAKVLHLYDHRDEISRDEIQFQSGMVLDRYSAPVLGEQGHYYGRIWTFRDITESKQADDALKSLATSFAHLAGRSFFEAVSRHIATTIGVDFVFVGEYNQKAGTVGVLGGYAKGAAMGDLNYSLLGTPCAEVIGQRTCFYPRTVQAQFPDDHLLTQMGIESYLGAPLYDKDGKPLGILVALHSQPLTNVQAITQLFNTFLDRVTAEMQRSKAQMALQQSLREKEFLLKEVHHRVKNNLQIVSSLLRLQASQLENPIAKAALHDMQNRVRSMALIHEHLYRSENLAQVDLAAYLRQICQQLFRALASTSGAIRLDLDLAPVQLGIDQAIPCGLLVNELFSNALKHGFPNGRTGEVRVELQPLADGPGWRLRVADTGVGLPAGFDLKHLTSLGLQLISDLSRQIGGRLEIGPGPGAVFEVSFQSIRG